MTDGDLKPRRPIGEDVDRPTSGDVYGVKPDGSLGYFPPADFGLQMRAGPGLEPEPTLSGGACLWVAFALLGAIMFALGFVAGVAASR